MGKIVIENEIGKVEWTPPPPLQQKFEAMPEEVTAKAKKWMAAMIEMYIRILLDYQHKEPDVKWLQEKTVALKQNIQLRLRARRSKPPRTMH